MKKCLFLILFVWQALLLHAYEPEVGDCKYAPLYAMQTEETAVLQDSLITYFPDGSFSENCVYEYNDKGYLKLEIKHKWNNDRWNNFKKKEYSYYRNGELKRSAVFLWEGSWMNKSLEEWTYDDHGNQITRDYDGYHMRYDNTYDDQGNLINVIEYMKKKNTNNNIVWEEYEKVVNGFDNDHHLTSSEIYEWKEGEWTAKEKHEYTYDANGNLTVVDCFIWYGYWYNNERYENTYDEDGNLISHTESYRSNGWQFLYKTEYSYYADGNMASDSIFNWNRDSKEWDLKSYSVYYYSTHTVIPPGTPTVSDTYDFEMDGVEYSILSVEDCTIKVADTRRVEYDDLIIPESIEVNGHVLKVTAIGDYSICPYYYFNSITREIDIKYFKSFQLPKTIETIGRHAFDSQGYLEEIEFSETLTSIDNSAFAGCWNLKKVTLHDGLKHLGDSVFYYCRQLEEINLPDDVEEIGSFAFGETGIRSFCFPASIRYAGSHLFAGCHNLEFVDLEKLKVTGMLPSALFKGSGVKEVVIPDWVTEIPDSFVMHCEKIEKFEFGKSVTHIGESSFIYCNLPSTFSLPQTIKVIDKYAFLYATAEGSIVIPGNVEEIGSYALYVTCDSLIFEPSDKTLLLNDEYYYLIGSQESHYLRLERSIRVKDGSEDNPYSIYLYGEVIELGKDCLDSFAQSGNFEIIYDRPVRLSILEGVEDLNYHYSCDYTNELLLPSTLKTISTSCFAGAKSLTTIDCRAIEPPLCDGKIFASNVYAKAKLTVPLGCKDAYLNAEGWKYFWEIEETADPITNENGIKEVQDEDSNWFSINNGELKASATLDLYTPDGRLVKHAANGDISDIAHGMYIIKCGSRTAKIAL